MAEHREERAGWRSPGTLNSPCRRTRPEAPGGNKLEPAICCALSSSDLLRGKMGSKSRQSVVVEKPREASYSLTGATRSNEPPNGLSMWTETREARIPQWTRLLRKA